MRGTRRRRGSSVGRFFLLFLTFTLVAASFAPGDAHAQRRQERRARATYTRHMREAARAAAKGDWAKARSAYAAADAVLPTKDTLGGLAESAYRLGDWEEARALYRDYVRRVGSRLPPRARETARARLRDAEDRLRASAARASEPRTRPATARAESKLVAPVRPVTDDDDDELDESSFPTVAYVTHVAFRGLSGTRESALRALLPRSLPATMTASEMVEFDRRINNLGIFDSVDVAWDPSRRALVVDVREKFTLTPLIEFASGRTLIDSYALLGLTEYNLVGRAAVIWGHASFEERRPNAEVGFEEHPFSPDQFMFGGGAFYESSSLRFDSEDAWYRNQVGGSVSLRPPYAYRTPLRYQIRAVVFREVNGGIQGTSAPPDGNVVRSAFEVAWDKFTWRDLSASGASFTVTGAVGGLFPTGQPRHSAIGTFIGAVAPTKTTSFMLRVSGEAVTTGTRPQRAPGPRGVRGPDDAFYRNHLQAFANLELRQAWHARRWARKAWLSPTARPVPWTPAAADRRAVRAERGRRREAHPDVPDAAPSARRRRRLAPPGDAALLPNRVRSVLLTRLGAFVPVDPLVLRVERPLAVHVVDAPPAHRRRRVGEEAGSLVVRARVAQDRALSELLVLDEDVGQVRRGVRADRLEPRRPVEVHDGRDPLEPCLLHAVIEEHVRIGMPGSKISGARLEADRRDGTVVLPELDG